MVIQGLRIYSSPLLPPDFYAIADWQAPQKSSTPEWHSVLFVNCPYNGGYYAAHPSLIEKLKETTQQPKDTE